MRVVLACFSHCWPSFLVVLGGAGRAVRWRRPSTAKTSRCQRWSSLVWHFTRHGAVTELSRSCQLSLLCSKKGDPGCTTVPMSPLREQRARGAVSSTWKFPERYWKSFLCWLTHAAAECLWARWRMAIGTAHALGS
jgi:hypothetical protein